jgi:phosphatidylethanolamine-binding protein (PEBP) family uncharacterized protein
MLFKIILAISLFVPVLAFAQATPLTVSFADAAWDGNKVPDDQHCAKHGGHGTSPALKISNIPAEANRIIVSFSNGAYKKLDNGGHGIIGMQIPAGTTTAQFPSIAENIIDMPKDVYIVSAQKGDWGKDGAAYMAPCSGGKGSRYYATVRAVNEKDGAVIELSKTDIELGKY